MNPEGFNKDKDEFHKDDISTFNEEDGSVVSHSEISGSKIQESFEEDENVFIPPLARVATRPLLHLLGVTVTDRART